MLLVIVGFQNTYKEFGSQLAKDFTGDGNFIYWIIAIGAIGALGYNKTLEPFSRAFMALIIVVIFLSNKGFFAQLNPQLKAGTDTKPLPAGGNASSSGGGGGGGGGTDIGGLINTAATIASFF